MSLLELCDVQKSYATNQGMRPVLRNIDLTLQEGELVSVVGYSGSGKSTLVSILAGLRRPDCGRVMLRGIEAKQPGPERGVVFQNYSLLPWLTVQENVMFAVQQVFPRESPRQHRERAEKYLAMVHLSHALTKRPHELSGGMRQRVSLARTLAMEPAILLLDEPLSALDALTRSTLQQELVNICEEQRCSILWVTNDVEEAILVADRVVPLLPLIEGATLGDAYPVSFKRPRVRQEIVQQESFQSLKRAIIDDLRSAQKARRMATQGA